MRLTSIIFSRTKELIKFITLIFFITSFLNAAEISINNFAVTPFKTPQEAYSTNYFMEVEPGNIGATIVFSSAPITNDTEFDNAAVILDFDVPVSQLNMDYAYLPAMQANLLYFAARAKVGAADTTTIVSQRKYATYLDNYALGFIPNSSTGIMNTIWSVAGDPSVNLTITNVTTSTPVFSGTIPQGITNYEFAYNEGDVYEAIIEVASDPNNYYEYTSQTRQIDTAIGPYIPPIENLNMTPTQTGSMHLTWDAPDYPDIAGYVILTNTLNYFPEPQNGLEIYDWSYDYGDPNFYDFNFTDTSNTEVLVTPATGWYHPYEGLYYRIYAHDSAYNYSQVYETSLMGIPLILKVIRLKKDEPWVDNTKVAMEYYYSNTGGR
ncbi:hypothetical protein BVX93_01525 [bacterium B13(2017)]|nr:hypothetical protein BVX93_01525 [bacterium B13(2017)]